MTTVEIHEFSTGITPQRLSDDSWVSSGFTGQYMNSTLSEIPHVVERSIANKEFSVAEGASSDRPTIIGRVVEPWHVVAFITKGRDEKGRGASFYRYFLTQSQNGTSTILNFLKQCQKQGQQITFNPFNQVINPHKARLVFSANTKANHQPRELPELLEPDPNYTPEQLNERAIAYSRFSGQPTSWAFNVEALEKPKRFQVILPTNDAAARRIRQSLASAPAATANHSIDEQAIKTAVKNLINASQPKPESFRTLSSVMDDTQRQLNDAESQLFWNTLFSGLGADNAIQQKIYSQSMVRLMTIRAIVLPRTLPSFWTWLGQISDRNQQKDLMTTSLALQGEGCRVVNDSASLRKSLLDGINTITIAVFNENIPPKYASWLVDSPGSIWSKALPQHLQNIKYDAAILLPQGYQQGQRSQSTEPQTIPEWQKIIRGLRNSRSPKALPNSKYLALGELFFTLNEPVLAACCYQSGAGLVPTEIYKEAKIHSEFNNRRPYNGNLLIRKKTTAEKILSFLRHPIVLGTIGILALIPITYFSFKAFKNWNTSRQQSASEQIDQSQSVDESNVATDQSGDSNLEFIQGTERLEGELEDPQAFDISTHAAVQGLINETASRSDGEVIQAEEQERALRQIIDTLLDRPAMEAELDLLNYRIMLPIDEPPQMDSTVREQWRALVSKYQVSRELEADGLLTEEGNTYQEILEDIRSSADVAPPSSEEAPVDNEAVTPPPNDLPF